MGTFMRFGVLLPVIGMLLIAAQAVVAGGPRTKTFVFEKRQGIAAAPARIFSVVSDFQEYPRLFPETHNQVTIVSDSTHGTGVAFDNVAVFKSVTFKNRWKVTELVRDRLIRMDNDTAGAVIILLHQVDYDTTDETMIAAVNIPPKFMDEVFAAYDREMKALKTECERRTPADSARGRDGRPK
jgi:hypothetical protein